MKNVDTIQFGQFLLAEPRQNPDPETVPVFGDGRRRDVTFGAAGVDEWLESLGDLHGSGSVAEMAEFSSREKLPRSTNAVAKLWISSVIRPRGGLSEIGRTS